MIKEAFQFLEAQLNAHLKQKLDLSGELVVATPRIKGNEEANNKVCFYLLNLDEELKSVVGFNGPLTENRLKFGALQLNVGVTANFEDYHEALKVFDLSHEFFLMNNTFDKESNPDMDDSISRIIIELPQNNVAVLASIYRVMDIPAMPTMLLHLRVIL